MFMRFTLPRSLLHHGRPPLLPPPHPRPFRRREQAQLAACAQLGAQRARRIFVRLSSLSVSPSAFVRRRRFRHAPPRRAAPASLGAPVPSTSSPRRPVEHKQRGRAGSTGFRRRSGAFAHCVRVVEMQRGDTRGKLCGAYCVALTGMLSRVYSPLEPSGNVMSVLSW